MSWNIPTAPFLTPSNSGQESEPYFFGTSTATTTWGIPLQDVNKPWLKTNKIETTEQINKEMEELKKNVHELTVENKKLEEENAKLQKSLFDLKRKCESKDTQNSKKLAELSQTITYAKSEIVALVEEKEELKTELNTEKSALRKAEQTAKDIANQLNIASTKATEVMNANSELVEENMRLNEKNRISTKYIKQCEKKIRELERHLALQKAKVEAEAASEAAEYEHVNFKPKESYSSEDGFELVSDVEVTSK